MSNTWVISDPHFGHSLASLERGFTNVEDHDNWLMSECRKRFKPADEIWWLGDIAFNGWRDRLPTTVGVLPGVHRLVLGNHDRPHPLNSRGHDYVKEWLPWFSWIGTMARVSWRGTGALLSHFPYTGDHTEVQRHDEWRPVDTGKLLIHGHTHSAEKVSCSDKGTLQLHAGVDAWRGPVLLLTLLALADHPD